MYLSNVNWWKVPAKVTDDIYPSTGSLDHRYLGSQEAQWDEGGVDHNAMIQRGRGIGTKSLKANGRLESLECCSLIGFDGKATEGMSFGVFQPSSGSINSVAGSERNNWESWFIRGDYQVGNAIRSWLHLSAIIWELEGSRDTNSIRIQCILFHHIAKDNKLMLQNRKHKFQSKLQCRWCSNVYHYWI